MHEQDKNEQSHVHLILWLFRNFKTAVAEDEDLSQTMLTALAFLLLSVSKGKAARFKKKKKEEVVVV